MRKLFGLIIMLVAVSSLSFMGCTRRPNAEQLQALEEQKNAALAAEQTVEDRKNEKRRLESTLQQKKSILKKAQDELAAVKQRLAEGN